MKKKGLLCDYGGARVDAGTLIKEVLAGPCVRDSEGNYHIQVMADGVKVFRNSMMTNVGIRAFNKDDYYNSMTGIRLLYYFLYYICFLIINIRAIIEGKDDYIHMRDVMTGLNNHILTEAMGPIKLGMSFWGGGITVVLLLHIIFIAVFSGDMVFTACVQGRENGYARDGYNCNYCEVHTRDLHKLTPSRPRELTRQYHLSHTFDPTNPVTFNCPGCGKLFETVADVDEDLPPVSPRDYADSHFGQSWQRPPLLHIEPSRYILCVLHLLLSCTKLVFKRGILEMLESEAQATLLNNRLQSLSICVPKQRKVSVKVAHDQSTRVKFTGKECVTLLEAWDGIVDEIVGVCINPDEWKRHACLT